MHRGKKKPGHKRPDSKIGNKTEEAPFQADGKPPGEQSSDASFSRRKIVSNWAKYEEKISFLDTEPEETNNFDYLLKSSSTDSNYFQLAAEKEWENQSVKPDGSLFSIDLKLLSSGLSCLPFYERIGLDVDLISPANVQLCDSEAKISLRKYKPTLDSHRSKIQESEGYSFSNTSTSLDFSQINLNPIIKTREKDGIVESSSNPITVTDDDDLEDWLDSVLEK